MPALIHFQRIFSEQQIKMLFVWNTSCTHVFNLCFLFLLRYLMLQNRRGPDIFVHCWFTAFAGTDNGNFCLDVVFKPLLLWAALSLLKPIDFNFTSACVSFSHAFGKFQCDPQCFIFLDKCINMCLKGLLT